MDIEICACCGKPKKPKAGPNPNHRPDSGVNYQGVYSGGNTGAPDIRRSATPLAQAWKGHRYGLQALKPAFEFIAVAQVPYLDRPIDSIVSTGAGALNIDAGRIATNEETWKGNLENAHNNYSAEVYGKFNLQYAKPSNPLGRWPANFLLHHYPDCNGKCVPGCPVKSLDEQSGNLTSGTLKGKYKETSGDTACYGEYGFTEKNYEANEGGASRFFFRGDWNYEVLEQIEESSPVYISKPSTAEREAGLDGQSTRIQNDHPTVKSISLNKYLASLLLPPEAYAPRRILIPFAGVGSEMIGAILAGWESVTGIEQSPHYVEIARARLAWWSQWPGWGQADVDKILATREPGEGQLRLFEVSL